MLRKIPLALVGLTVGSILTVLGFIAYGIGNSTLNLAGFFYGIPLLLGGLALKAAELKPIPYESETSDEVVALRLKQATSTQNQVRLDVTRYRYGQEAHLDEALERVGLSPNDDQRPILTKVKEVEKDGKYTLILYFDSPLVSEETWHQQQEKITKFFGPDITTDVDFNQDNNEVALSLISA